MARLCGGAPKQQRRPIARQSNQVAHAVGGGRCWPREPIRHKERRRPASVLYPMLDLRGIESRQIRCLRTFKTPPHSTRRQLLALVEHLYVDYPVPAFLLTSCLSEETPFDHMRPLWRRWMVAAAQGESFLRAARPLLTSREAHMFLGLEGSDRIHEQVWRAKLLAAGVPRTIADKLLSRILTFYLFDGSGQPWEECLPFFARYCVDMDEPAIGEIIDCLAWKFRHEPEFRLKGRTLRSMAAISDDWHSDMQRANIRKTVEWTGLRISPWSVDTAGLRWTVTELCSNVELLKEGRVQRHCVLAYLPLCRSGKTSIFSLRGSDGTKERARITFEVDGQRSIVQIRGFGNRPATAEERRILWQWALAKGVHFEVSLQSV